jgi:SAM-dependent methyltransferase
MNDLTEVSTHFRFGENWQGYLKHIDADTMREAEAGLLRLIPADRFAGASFIDIGCGSGIHAVVAQKLGAKVTAVDVDPDSVFAARMAAKMFRSDITIREESVFDLSGKYDIVYSWGVLVSSWPAPDGGTPPLVSVNHSLVLLDLQGPLFPVGPPAFSPQILGQQRLQADREEDDCRSAHPPTLAESARQS